MKTDFIGSIHRNPSPTKTRSSTNTGNPSYRARSQSVKFTATTMYSGSPTSRTINDQRRRAL